LKKPTKRAGRVAQGVDPEFKPQNCKKKTRRNRQVIVGRYAALLVKV
jgi:hypothetical protein